MKDIEIALTDIAGTESVLDKDGRCGADESLTAFKGYSVGKTQKGGEKSDAEEEEEQEEEEVVLNPSGTSSAIKQLTSLYG